MEICCSFAVDKRYIMALINCPQCGKQVSDKALKCPHCGLDMTVSYIPPKEETAIREESQKKPRKVWPVVAIVVGCIALVAVASWFFVFHDTQKANEDPAHETPKESTAFPYSTHFTGNIGAEGSMTIDGYGGGFYSYDNNGAILTKSIKVKSYDKNTGHLLIESYDKSGNYVGLFDGYTRNDNSYSGTFTNYIGGKLEFQLNAEPRSDDKSTSTVDAEIRQALNQWVACHNDKNLTKLAALYDNQVEYFQANYSNSQVYDSKKKALDKNPQFRMEISNVKIDEYLSYYEASFDKIVWYSPSSTQKTYPSYLWYKKVNGSWKIIKENDRTSNSNAKENKSTSSYSSARYVVIDGTELRLRLGPSTSADTFKWKDGTNRHPKVGERFKYLGESGDFYQIDFHGHKLWVSKFYTHIE